MLCISYKHSRIHIHFVYFLKCPLNWGRFKLSPLKESVLEIIVSEAAHYLVPAVFVQKGDIRQGCSVEGIVLHEAVLEHINEYESVPRFEGFRERILADYIACHAGVTGKDEVVGILSRRGSAVQRRCEFNRDSCPY